MNLWSSNAAADNRRWAHSSQAAPSAPPTKADLSSGGHLAKSPSQAASAPAAPPKPSSAATDRA
jgi:hypothetical protein